MSNYKDYEDYEETWKSICKTKTVKESAKAHGDSLLAYLIHYEPCIIPIGVSAKQRAFARKELKHLVDNLLEGKKLHKSYDARTYPKYMALEEYCTGEFDPSNDDEYDEYDEDE